MSQWRGRFDNDSEFGIAVEWLSDWYQVPAVLLLTVFMFWTRARTWGNFIVDGEVLFAGNDPWYHFREVLYVTDHWPQTMPYDVWTNFPQGTSVSQFGTIYDQVIGTVALVVGLGNPSDQTVAMVLLFTPAVVGALLTIPTYYLGKRLGSRFTGVLAVLILALASGSLLSRSIVGFSDHHVAEAFTQALAVLTAVVALQVADSEKPVWELVVDRDYAGLRKPVGYAALAGFGTSLYIWTWPPGILLLGILGLYFTVQLSINHLRGESPEHVAFVGVVLFGVATPLLLIPIDQATISATTFSLLQPGIALAGAVWCALLAWISRYWNDNSYPAYTYPLTAVGILTALVVLLALITPDVFQFLVRNTSRVLVPGTTGQTAGTVGEVQPLQDPINSFYEWFGLTFILAAVGVILALGRQYLSDTSRSELLLVAVWFCVLVLAALTQQRFVYYLTIPIAALTAYVVGAGTSYLRSLASDDSDGIQSYQVLAVLTVLLLTVAPMVAVSNVVTNSQRAGPGGIAGWDGGLDWMEENTPAEGTFADADNEMDPRATIGKTDDYQYEEGAYGVLSWWDYGHWITAAGNRIPVANPFQESANEAARFILAQNESAADDVLAEVSDGENRDTRYFMVDWRMATANPGFSTRLNWGKFFAPPNFVKGVSESDYTRRVRALIQSQGGSQVGGAFFTLQKQDYYESMVTRLYRYHGSAAWPNDVPTSRNFGAVPVTVWGETQVELNDGTQTTWYVPPQGNNATTVEFERSISAARQRVAEIENNTNNHAQVGGIGKYPAEYVPALEEYRLVHATNRTVNGLLASQPGLLYFAQRSQQFFTGVNNQVLGAFAERYNSYTKTFEHVEGATIEGTGPADSRVRARVQMRIPTTGQTFTYTQQARTGDDGSFSMKVPYSTTGYDEYGPDNGYTNTSIRATGPYQIATLPTLQNTTQVFYNATASVTEGQVIGQDDSVTEVELTREEIELSTNSTGSGAMAEPTETDVAG